MPIRIKVSFDARRMQRGLTDLAKKQIPFAISQAVNAVAQKVIDAETAALDETFDQPRSFTKQAFTMASHFGGQRASKRNPVAIIVAKPIQEAYLAPSEFGEPQSLGQGKRVRTPVNIKTGSGGNIPKDAIARLLQEPDVFIGSVNGTNGIWQRPTAPRPKGTPRRKIKSNTTGRLKLLVAFTRPVRVKTHLRFRERAAEVVGRSIDAEFDRALAKALATAR